MKSSCGWRWFVHWPVSQLWQILICAFWALALSTLVLSWADFHVTHRGLFQQPWFTWVSSATLSMWLWWPPMSVCAPQFSFPSGKWGIMMIFTTKVCKDWISDCTWEVRVSQALWCNEFKCDSDFNVSSKTGLCWLELGACWVEAAAIKIIHQYVGFTPADCSLSSPIWLLLVIIGNNLPEHFTGLLSCLCTLSSSSIVQRV